MSSCEGGRFSRTASTTTTGSSAATAPLTLISAESTPQKSIISTMSRKRLAPAPRASTCPVQAVSPVFSSAAADHEERGDEDRRRVAEAGERLVEREDAGRPERHGAADADAITGSRSQTKRPMTAAMMAKTIQISVKRAPAAGQADAPPAGACRTIHLPAQSRSGNARRWRRAEVVRRGRNNWLHDHSTASGERHDGEGTGVGHRRPGARAAFSTAS